MHGQPYNPVHLDRLRATRGIVDKDVTIKEEMGMLLTHIKRGVLTVCAPNASVKFKLDAWLRAGGEQTVGQAARSVTKVRVL
jgi:hypothetical protein